MYYGRGRERESSAFIVAICCDYCKATRNVFARQIIYWFLRGKRKILIIPTDSDVRIVSTCSDDRQTLSGTPHKPPGQEKQEARDDDDDPPAGDGNGRRESRMQANCTLAILQDAKSNSSRQVSFCLEGLVPGCERRAALIRDCTPTQEEGWYLYHYHLRRHQDWGRYALSE